MKVTVFILSTCFFWLEVVGVPRQNPELNIKVMVRRPPHLKWTNASPKINFQFFADLSFVRNSCYSLIAVLKKKNHSYRFLRFINSFRHAFFIFYYLLQYSCRISWSKRNFYHDRKVLYIKSVKLLLIYITNTEHMPSIDRTNISSFYYQTNSVL